MALRAVILAAGAGTRMKSDLPKPLHEVCGKAMVLHVIDALEISQPLEICVVVGHGGDQVASVVSTLAPSWANVTFATQHQQHGTGHATQVGLTGLTHPAEGDAVIVLAGDTPLLTGATIHRLVEDHVTNSRSATILTSELDDPTGYGRIVRAADDSVQRIVEQRDASPEELLIKEWNAGVYVFEHALLAPALEQLGTNNSQGEYYLTDVIASLAQDGKVGAVTTHADETVGVNDREQLAAVEQMMIARDG
ncbi:MAG: hypothetical protein EBS76_00570 [Actinobacteria bacterium]|nr:hypothetical protein [Actinomycetota bacterium]